ncbi:hypothetical protein Poli38472_013356 [Pythium oligandrum]|uniref:Uncharacterized protein n=1 Tax=Pythium oligandrum TaxID=41045 RepID=A0A8K1C8F2_PYTOL|nr:hypothetical protein Poli38472_013356 [Pythium oligandrum]|eukprot:TMW57882.1 hypothetical protein Poli38472_013356 [Pythium oligandrum]
MAVTTDEMDFYGYVVFMPLTLLINFSLFQYLLTVYFRRRHEVRVMLLLVCAFIGFVTLVPFAYSDEEFVGHLNDISETSSTLSFLIQIVIIGRDILRKVRIRSLLYMTIFAELLCLFGLLVVLQNIIEISTPHLDLSVLDPLDNIMEDGGLVFVFVFRFYFLAMILGFRRVLETKRLELFAYLLFVTHEYPWTIAKYCTGVTWEDAQALWNRLTIMLCILLTIRDKIRSSSGKLSHGTTMGPSKEVSIHSPSLKSTGPRPLSVRSPSAKVITVATLVRAPSRTKVEPIQS